MKTKMFKLGLVIAIILMLCTGVCFAAEEANTTNVTSEVSTTTTTPEATAEEEATEEEPSIISDDLYSFSTDVTVNKIVDGNAHIFGQDVTIDNQIIGNLFVIADTLTFTEKSYVQGTCYVIANKIVVKGMVYDLYSSSTDLSIASSGIVYRDLRALSSSVDIQGRVGRNAFIGSDDITIATDAGSRIYGNLDYSSSKDLGTLEGIVEGTVTHSNPSSSTLTTGQIVMNYVVSAIAELLFTTVLFLLILWLTPKTIANWKETMTNKFPISLGVGVLALIAIPLVSIFTMVSEFTIGIGIALLTVYILSICITSAILSISLAKLICDRFHLEKKVILFLITLATCLVLWALKQIPYLGGYVVIFITIVGLGILIENLIYGRKKAKELEQ